MDKNKGLLQSNTNKSPYLKGHACLIKKLKDSRRRRNLVEGSKDTNKICECKICILHLCFDDPYFYIKCS